MTEVLGAPCAARRDDSTNDFNAPTRWLSEEFAYASLWTHGTLSRRERSLITLGMLCALNRPHESRIHLTGAINNGCTVEEIRELFTHSVAYCGFPAAIDALRIAEEVLREKGLLGLPAVRVGPMSCLQRRPTSNLSRSMQMAAGIAPTASRRPARDLPPLP